MFKTPDGEDVFIIDGHTHFWDGSPENQSNIHGKQFIDCFYAYHTALSPKDKLWPKDKFEKYSAEQMYHDLFVDGPDDMAIVQSTYLTEFYKNGFNTIERNLEIANTYKDRFIVNGAFDPRDGEEALEYIHFMKENYGIKGVKLYTAEWKGESRGWKLTDPERLSLPRAVPEARHHQHPCPQGTNHHPARQGRLRCPRRRPRGNRLPGPELHHRALRPAEAR